MASRVVVDHAAVRRLLTSPAGPVVKDLLRRGRRVEARAKQLCPVDTGRLRSSITTELAISGGLPVVRVGTNVKYARWVHDGTGVYGPAHRRITPRSASVMVFKPRGSKTLVFARSTAGMRGRPFLLNALEAAR